MNFDGSDLVHLTPGDGTHSVQYSADKTVFIDTWSRVDLPPRHVLRRASDGKQLCELETATAKDLYATGWQHAERFVQGSRRKLTSTASGRPSNLIRRKISGGRGHLCRAARSRLCLGWRAGTFTARQPMELASLYSDRR